MFTLAALSLVALVGLAAMEDLPLMTTLSLTKRTLQGEGGRVSSSSDSDSAARASGRSTTMPASPALNEIISIEIHIYAMHKAFTFIFLKRHSLDDKISM